MRKDTNLPTHVAIIMDGNRRWARRWRVPKNVGHQRGAKRLIDISLYANEIGIKYLTVFAFSTENWQRPQDEVDYLMRLPLEFFDEMEERFKDENIRILVIGERNGLPTELLEKIDYTENLTKDNTGLTLIIAFNYGAKLELVNAIKDVTSDVIAKKLDMSDIDEDLFDNYLYTKNIPDVDLLIRTSGELRISNFLLWQIAYSELYFTKTLWPSFSKRAFRRALRSYQQRHRRFGSN